MTEDSLSSSATVPAIRIDNLHKVYRASSNTIVESRALDGLSIVVPQGRFYGFLGPNGAGKTTTIQILMGTVQPTSGTVEVMGMRLPDDSLAIRKQLGLVPDDTLLFDYLTGVEYVEFVGRLYGLNRGVARERSAELMHLFELSTTDRKLIGEYSKGMRKRVAMAAALIHRPRLFLMDEPFEGVDAVGARLMKDILQEQTRHGATVFLTSHVLEVVERLCDEVAIINHGKLVAHGSIAELSRSGTGGGSTLEDIFVRIVGSDHQTENLSWL